MGSCTMTLGHLTPQGRPSDFSACFLDHCHSSEPAEDPRNA